MRLLTPLTKPMFFQESSVSGTLNTAVSPVFSYWVSFHVLFSICGTFFCLFFHDTCHPPPGPPSYDSLCAIPRRPSNRGSSSGPPGQRKPSCLWRANNHHVRPLRPLFLVSPHMNSYSLEGRKRTKTDDFSAWHVFEKCASKWTDHRRAIWKRARGPAHHPRPPAPPSLGERSWDFGPGWLLAPWLQEKLGKFRAMC